MEIKEIRKRNVEDFPLDMLKIIKITKKIEKLKSEREKLILSLEGEK